DGEGQIQNELRGKGSKCKSEMACIILGGSCVSNARLCKGRLAYGGCKGKNCQCCVPGCPEGHFIFPSTNQCFKLYDDRTRNFTEANSTCRANGLVLAKPYDVLNLRRYLVERFR
ncbi:unnamed protein product, partial [Meganyctiphanes norvegica]